MFAELGRCLTLAEKDKEARSRSFVFRDSSNTTKEPEALIQRTVCGSRTKIAKALTLTIQMSFILAPPRAALFTRYPRLVVEWLPDLGTHLNVLFKKYPPSNQTDRPTAADDSFMFPLIYQTRDHLFAKCRREEVAEIVQPVTEEEVDTAAPPPTGQK